MSIIRGQIYVLESKARDLSINKEQADRLMELDLEHKQLEMIESIWNKYGENGFDGYEPKQEFVDEWSKTKKTS
jgi:hypothetical protein